MNTLYDRKNQRDLIAKYLETLTEYIIECRHNENEILDGIGEKGPTEIDSILIKDIIAVKDTLLKAKEELRQIYDRY